MKYEYGKWGNGTVGIIELETTDNILKNEVNKVYTNYADVTELLNEKEKHIELLIQKIEKYEELINTIYHMTAPYRK